jgi:uncharacterized protein
LRRHLLDIDPRHEFCPDDISLLDPPHLAQPALLTPSRVTDLYLVALARHHGASLATFDGRIPPGATPSATSRSSQLNRRLPVEYPPEGKPNTLGEES